MSGRRVIYTSSADWGEVLDRRLVDRVIGGRHPMMRTESWTSDATTTNPPEGYDYLYRSSRYWAALFEREDYSAIVSGGTSRNEITVKIAANTEEELESFIAVIREQIQPVHLESGTISVKFWTNGARGPQSVNRKIDAPAWDDLAGNYHSATDAKMQHLARNFRPAHGGQLILWHGAPGTGKTYALRAISREWAKWCSTEYVVDPEKFFGNDAAYMMQVLLEAPSYPSWSDDDDEDEEYNPKTDRWRLLIFEDTGELLSEDASTRSGQGLSRLLNVVDGLIGQGLKVLILITTNEELRHLHSAVSRPGRAAVKVHFTDLEAAEAVLWAARAETTLPNLHRPYSLAELYALRDGFFETEPTVSQSKALGFRPLTATPA